MAQTAMSHSNGLVAPFIPAVHVLQPFLSHHHSISVSGVLVVHVMENVSTRLKTVTFLAVLPFQTQVAVLRIIARQPLVQNAKSGAHACGLLSCGGQLNYC